MIYSGILPDLFREGQGILVKGELDAAGVFRAVEVPGLETRRELHAAGVDAPRPGRFGAAALIPELGNVSLVLALILSVVSGTCGLFGAAARQARWMRAAASTTLGQFVFVALAFAVLVHAFVTDDFSVAYVAHNSNSLLPWYYKVSAVWGAHEGSFLLWVLIMTVWMTAVALGGGTCRWISAPGRWVSWAC